MLYVPFKKGPNNLTLETESRSSSRLERSGQAQERVFSKDSDFPKPYPQHEPPVCRECKGEMMRRSELQSSIYGVVLNEIFQSGYLGAREVLETDTTASQGEEAFRRFSGRPAIRNRLKGHIFHIEPIARQEDIEFRGPVFLTGGHSVLKGEPLVADIYDLP